MTTIEEIFNLTKSQLKSKLIEYEDETHYSNNLKRINAVIIHSFNKELLNTKEMEIVESDNYDRVMNLNPESYSQFLELLNQKKKSTKINSQLLKRWKNSKLVTTLEGHTDGVRSVVVSDKYIISGSADKTIKIWDLTTFELVATLEGHNSIVNSVIVSDKYIISGSFDRTIKIWDLSTFKLIAILKGHNGYVYSLTVSDKYIISGSVDKTIKIWDLSTFELVKTLKGHDSYVYSVTVSGIINTTDEFGKINSVENTTNKFGNIISKQYIISGSADETIKIWNLSTFKLVTTLKGHNSIVSSVVVSSVENTTDLPDNIGKQYIISGSFDKTIKIWDLSTFKLVKTLEGHNYHVTSVTVSNFENATTFAEQYIISGSFDGIIKIWDLLTFELVSTLEGHDNVVKSVAISDKYIISGSYDKTIKIWEQN